MRQLVHACNILAMKRVRALCLPRGARKDRHSTGTQSTRHRQCPRLTARRAAAARMYRAGHRTSSGTSGNITGLKFTNSYEASTFMYIVLTLEDGFAYLGLHSGSDRRWDNKIKPRFDGFNEGDLYLVLMNHVNPIQEYIAESGASEIVTIQIRSPIKSAQSCIASHSIA
jgi:hypothetical protein